MSMPWNYWSPQRRFASHADHLTTPSPTPFPTQLWTYSPTQVKFFVLQITDQANRRPGDDELIQVSEYCEDLEFRGIVLKVIEGRVKEGWPMNYKALDVLHHLVTKNNLQPSGLDSLIQSLSQIHHNPPDKPKGLGIHVLNLADEILGKWGYDVSVSHRNNGNFNSSNSGGFGNFTSFGVPGWFSSLANGGGIGGNGNNGNGGNSGGWIWGQNNNQNQNNNTNSGRFWNRANTPNPPIITSNNNNLDDGWGSSRALRMSLDGWASSAPATTSAWDFGPSTISNNNNASSSAWRSLDSGLGGGRTGPGGVSFSTTTITRGIPPTTHFEQHQANLAKTYAQNTWGT